MASTRPTRGRWPCAETSSCCPPRTGRGSSRSGVYRGELRGDAAFERCREGLPESFDDNIDTYCLDALPDDGSFAAFGTSDGRVFASEDAGATWSELAGGLPSVRRVLVLP